MRPPWIGSLNTTLIGGRARFVFIRNSWGLCAFRMLVFTDWSRNWDLFEFRLRRIFPWLLELKHFLGAVRTRSYLHSFQAWFVLRRFSLPCDSCVVKMVLRLRSFEWVFRFISVFGGLFLISLWYIHEWSFTVPSGEGYDNQNLRCSIYSCSWKKLVPAHRTVLR